jgi:hypothetical protein
LAPAACVYRDEASVLYDALVLTWSARVQSSAYSRFGDVSLFQLGSQLTIAIGLSLVTSGCKSVQTTLEPAMAAPGPNFLLRNAAARGVVTTPSGLQYYIQFRLRST